MNGKHAELRNSGSFFSATKLEKNKIWLVYICLYLTGAIIFRITIYHCGKSLVHIYDAKDQYLPFLKYLNLYYREMIQGLLHGQFHVKMFDYSLGFGMDPLRALSYYGMADPINFPVIFFNQTQILQYFQFIVQFRPFLAGVAFIGMCFHFRKVNYMVPFCALFYLCSGWTMYAFSVHPFFINFMILLPMAIVGIDRILYKKSPSLFILAIFLAGCVGFYFLFMISISMFVFAVVRLIYRRNEILCPGKQSMPGRTENSGAYENSGMSLSSMVFGAVGIVLKSFGYYFLGLAMSFFILLPSLLGVMESIRGASADLPENMFIYPLSTLMELYSKTVMPGPGCDSLSFSMIGLFSIVAVLARRRKDETGILVLVGMVLWFLPLWSVFMSGIAMPNYRWFFALSLLTMYLCTDIEGYLAQVSKIQKTVFLIAGAVGIAASFWGYASGAEFNILRILAVITAAVLLIISFVPCRGSVRRFVCIVLICMQCIVNTSAFFSPVWFDKVNEFTDQEVEKRINQSLIGTVRNDPQYNDIFRTELANNNAYNTSSVLHIPSIQTYGSIIPETVSDFTMETENNSMTMPFAISGLDNRAALMQLCSVAYYVSPPEGNYIPHGYEKEYKGQDTTIYYNQYALTPGYVFYRTYNPEDMEKRNGIEKQSLMLQGAVTENAQIPEVSTDSMETGVEKISYEIKEKNGVAIGRNALHIEENVEEPWIDVTMAIPENSEIYARLKGFEGKEKLVLRIVREDESSKALLGREPSRAYGQENFSSLIETTKEGEGREAHYRIYFSGAHECRLDELEFYAYNLKQYEKTAAELAENCLQDVQFGDNSISGKVAAKEEGILCMSVPYSSGWKAYVDGEQRDCLKANYLCTAVLVPEGEHEIVFRYKTPGAALGTVVSVISVIFFIILVRQKGKSLHRGHIDHN